MSDTASSPAPRRAKTWLVILAALCLAAGGGAYWYKNGAAAKKDTGAKNRPVPVALAEAKAQDVEVFLSGLGTVTPQSSVTVKSRVDGQLMQVLVREGQVVKAGELLLLIDPRPFQVQLAQAEGQLKRDTALLNNARLDLKRFNDLMAQGAIARQQYDTQQALVHQYEGAVATDKATADSARLQITYSRITAPFAGQVGLRQVDPGNMVRSSDQTGLLVVNQISPISVLFTLPEDQLPRVLAKLRAGDKLRVDAYDREQTHKLAQGELSSMDNQIDPTTGTVRLKASFTNTGGELYPNQFVNAKLLVEVLKDAIVVPAAAVQRGQKGTYLYVVGADNIAHARPVSVGESSNTESVILNGLALGEKVVMEGADRLRDGAPVEIKAAKPAAGKGQDAANATAPETGKPSAATPEATKSEGTKSDARKSEAAKSEVAKPEIRPAAKAEPKGEKQPETKPEAKAETKVEKKPGAKPEQNSAPKTDAAAAPHPGSQPKAKP